MEPSDQERNRILRVERIVRRSIVVLLGIVLVGVTLLFIRNGKKISQPDSPQPSVPRPTYGEELTETLFYYPKNLVLGQPLPVQSFVSQSGNTVSMRSFQGRYVVLMYFASWCTHCDDQFRALGDLDSFFAQYPDVTCFLVDKLDGQKETQETAKAYLDKKGFQLECLYDQGLTAYEAAGLQIVPTTIILDLQGDLAFCHPGALENQSQLASMLSYVRNGPAADTESFVTESMMSPEGGVYSRYQDSSGLATGHDILSESQGLLMEYAAERNDPYLFGFAYRYVQEQMMTYSLPVWVVEDEQTITVNALLDDLRMLKALNLIQNRSGGYLDGLQSLAQNIVLYNFVNQQPVDFYDFLYKVPASRFTLCYADLDAMDTLSYHAPIAEGLPAAARKLVSEGYLGDHFPLYRNYYDYTTGTYDTGSINMAEGLYTLYHLAEVDELKQASLDWLRGKMASGGIFARYNQDGQVTVGYEYESPAVYALVGLIALEADDPILLTQAVSRMEQFRVFDTDSPANGAFGGEDIGQIASYDQLMALLLYAKMEK